MMACLCRIRAWVLPKPLLRYILPLLMGLNVHAWADDCPFSWGLDSAWRRDEGLVAVSWWVKSDSLKLYYKSALNTASTFDYKACKDNGPQSLRTCNSLTWSVTDRQLQSDTSSMLPIGSDTTHMRVELVDSTLNTGAEYSMWLRPSIQFFYKKIGGRLLPCENNAQPYVDISSKLKTIK